jgi:hypothetical protein
VVTIDHPKNASMIFASHGCGAVAALDARDLAQKIQAVLASGKDSSVVCRSKALTYEWEAITDRIEENYREVGRESAPGR